MNFFKAIKTCYNKYFDFSGRATRSEFWYFFLFKFLLISLICTCELCLYYFTLIDEYLLFLSYLIIDTIVLFSLIIPSLAVDTRRLHDTNRSGAVLFIMLIPIIGGILLFIFYCGKSFPYGNRYGENIIYHAAEYKEVNKKEKDKIKPNKIMNQNERHQPWKDY